MSISIKHLDLAQRESLLRDAYSNRTHYIAEVLDCYKAWHRTPIDRDFEDMMSMFNDTCCYYVTNRGKYVEIAFSTMTEPEYFVWIHVDPIIANQLLAKYAETETSKLAV